MQLGEISSLSDVPGFEALRGASQKFKIEFTLFGSSVRRLAGFILSNKTYDIFNLAPYTSDFDMIYTGAESIKGELIDYLSIEFPYFDHFRWQIYSEFDYDIFKNARLYNHIVPASLITLSTDPFIGWIDDFGGIDDIKTGKYRFIKNEFYHLSPLYKLRRDLDVFSKIIFYNILLEDNRTHLGQAPLISYNEKQIKTIVESLVSSDYLRKRFRYLLNGFRARVYLLNNLHNLYIMEELRGFLAQIDHVSKNDDRYPFSFNFSNELEFVKNKGQVISSVINGDLTRLELSIGPWWMEGEALSKFNNLIKIYFEGYSLERNQKILASTPSLSFSIGKASCSHMSLNTVHEFIYFCLPIDSSNLNIESENLSTILNMQGNGKSEFFNCPCVCEYNGDDHFCQNIIRIRINIGMLFEQAPRYFNTNEVTFQVFLIQRQLDSDD